MLTVMASGNYLNMSSEEYWQKYEKQLNVKGIYSYNFWIKGKALKLLLNFRVTFNVWQTIKKQLEDKSSACFLIFLLLCLVIRSRILLEHKSGQVSGKSFTPTPDLAW